MPINKKKFKEKSNELNIYKEKILSVYKIFKISSKNEDFFHSVQSTN